MPDPDESTELGSAERLFNEFLAAGNADLDSLLREHPAQAEELLALHATWRAVEALSGPRREPPFAEGSVEGGQARYSDVTEIGRGGMGVVYRAHDERLGRSVAFKIQRQGESGTPGPARERFWAEARISAQLDHPGVVPIHEVDQDEDGRPYFTMRLIEGRTLHEVLELTQEERDGWNRTRALGVLVRVCETMAFAHARGVVHRDLKPKNVMVGRFGEVYVMDWGVAKVLGDRDPGPDVMRSARPGSSGGGRVTPGLTHAGSIVGTPAFMAPEQARDAARIDPRADVYAVGAILYQLLSGRAPYADRDSGTDALTALRTSEPTPLATLCPGAPPELVAIAGKAMAREPGTRYASAEQLRRDLSAFLEQRVVQAYRTGFWSELTKWFVRNRRQALALVGGATIAFVGLSAAVVLLQGQKVQLEASNQDLDEALKAAERRGYSTNVALAQQFLAAGDSPAARQRLAACPPELRGWEWDYLSTRLDASQGRLDLDSPRVSAARCAPEGDRLAYGTLGGDVLVHDLDDGSVDDVLLRCDRATVRALDFFPVRPASLVSGHEDGTLVVWDLTREAERERIEVDGAVHTLEFAPDGRLAVGVGGDLQIRSPAALSVELEFAAHAQIVTSVAWDPAARRLATASHDGTVAVWDAALGTEVARFVVTPANDLGRHTSQVSWSPSGAFVAAAFPTGVFCVFAVEDGRELARVRTEYWAYAVRFVTDDTLLVGGTDSLEAWDWRAERSIRRWPGASGRVLDIERHANRLYAIEHDLGVRQFSLDEPQRETLSGHLEDVTGLSVQPGRRLVASASRDGSARLWDLESGACLRVFDELPVERDSIAWADDSTLLTGLSDGSVAEWNVHNGELENRWTFGQESSRALCVSPDGRLAAAADFQGNLLLWDRERGELIGSLTVAPHWFKPAFSGDGGRLAVVDPSRQGIELRTLPGLELERTLWGTHTDPIKSLAFSSDGRRLVSAGEDGLVVLWDLATGGAREFRGHAREVLDAVFLDDDRRIASGGVGRQIRIWDVESGQCVLTLFGHESWVLDLQAAGRVLCSSSADRTLRLWRPSSPW